MTESAQRGLFSEKCSKIQNLRNIFEKYTIFFGGGFQRFFVGGHKIVFWGENSKPLSDAGRRSNMRRRTDILVYNIVN